MHIQFDQKTMNMDAGKLKQTIKKKSHKMRAIKKLVLSNIRKNIVLHLWNNNNNNKKSHQK